MHKKIICTLMLSALPFLAHASDITINNETKAYGTLYFESGLKLCSSWLGDSGIIKPGQKGFVIKESQIKSYCGKSCKAHIFASNNCEKDKEVATAHIDINDGVSDLNYDHNKYEITGSGTNITIASKQGGLKNWLKSLF